MYYVQHTLTKKLHTLPQLHKNTITKKFIAQENKVNDKI